MKITIAKSAGFCIGVKRALDIAVKTSQSNNNVFMLGDIVHNQEVIKTIKKSGIKKIKTLVRVSGDILLIRAHGAPKKTYQKAKQLGYKIIDATCPMVKEIHKTAQKYEKKGYQIIVIGDKKHAEVQGIVGQLEKKATVVPPSSKLKKENFFKIKKAAIVVQSTQNCTRVEKMFTKLEKYIPDLKFINTICAPTRRKQEEIKKMPLSNDLILIVGSKTSANTKRLYQIAKKINPHTHWIENEHEINPSWLKKVKTVGITAGSSTPKRLIDSVFRKITQISQTKLNQ